MPIWKTWLAALRSRLAAILKGRVHWLIVVLAALAWMLVVFVPGEAPFHPEVVGTPALPSYGDELDANMVVVRISVRRLDRANGSETELSHPTISTVLGTRVAIDQTLRLRPGHEIDIALQATARSVSSPKRAAEQTLVLDEDLQISERERSWKFWRVQDRVLLHSQVVHYDAARRPHRVTFGVQNETFAVDLEVVAHGDLETP